MEGLFQRILDRRHTALVGGLPEPPARDPSFHLVRVACVDPERPLGVVLDVRQRVEQLLDAPPQPRFDAATARVWSGLRRRLLGELLERDPAASLVESLNRLSDAVSRPTAIVIDGLQAADPASLEALERIVAHSGWSRLPIVLRFASEPGGSSKRLLEALEKAEGAGSVIQGIGPSPAAGAPAALPRGLPLEALRVLRAAALIGSPFEASIVADLLGTSELDALYWLQVAHDAGVALVDDGGGIFHLPEPVSAELRRGLMPSLSSAWHRRLARLLAERVRVARSTTAPPSRAPSRPTLPPSTPPQSVDAPTLRRGEAAALPRTVPSRLSPVPERTAAREVPSSPGISPESRGPRRRMAEPAAAARHAEAAGDVDLAAEQYVVGARRAALLGAYAEASTLARRALELLGDAPSSSRRRLARITALLELARVKWVSAVPGEPSALSDALELIGECRARLLPDDPAELCAAVAALAAQVRYDVGDPESLELALSELTETSRALLDSGHPLEAARLLNDEAAIWVRLGDAVRAHHLLRKSREIFSDRATEDPLARAELAETDHLLGRLVLHVPPRPGHGQDAIEVGIEHAHRAELAYQQLGRARELGRTLETLGRLEMAAGRHREATGQLSRAAELQQRTGDVIGLARTASGLAELAREAGDLQNALTLLAGSVELNLEKGSPVGLAFNRQALGTLVRELPTPMRERLAEPIDLVARRIEKAESLLGRIELAPDLGHAPRPSE